MAATRRAIVDTGPLVALLDRTDRYHLWVEQRIDELRPPLLVCEAVLGEAMYLLRHSSALQNGVFRLLEGGAIVVAFQIAEHVATLRELLAKYRDRPMSLADACIVRMAEIHDRSAVFTLDSDFIVYRKNGRTPIELVCPPMN
jgi:predicted nucleic acid-binding protein